MIITSFTSLCQFRGFNCNAKCPARLTIKLSTPVSILSVLTHIHDSSGRSQEISTDRFPFRPETTTGAVTLIEETSVPPLPNLHLSASRVSSISCSRPTSTSKFLYLAHQSEPATQKRQAVSMIHNPRNDLDSLHSELSTQIGQSLEIQLKQEEQCQ